MARRNTPHRIRTTSRSAGRKRKRRLSWFVVGTSFGALCASALTSLNDEPAVIAAKNSSTPVNVASEAPLTVSQALPGPAPVRLIMPSGKPVPATTQQPVAKAEEPTPPVVEQPPVVKAEAAPEPKPDPIQYPLNIELKVSSGDTFITMLTDAGAPYEEAHKVLQASRKLYNPRSMSVGKTMTLTLDKPKDAEAPVITSLLLPQSLTTTVEIHRDKKGKFSAKKVVVPLERTIAQANGTIKSSLYQTGEEIGLPSSMVGEIINAYSYDVDFQREIRTGDKINVLYERLETKDGKPAGTGSLIYAALKLGKRDPLKLYRYTDKEGISGYYNADGESVRKALLRTPVNGARISSGYGRRKHPILGYSRMHKGIDFAAPTGTPIYAAGDGRVSFAGRKGGYGNYLRIKHTGKYDTAYAHLSRFASGIRPGKRVKQGQIIAYVGSTGRSTGPHLHYEILAYGKQVNPAGVKFKTGKTLKGTELAQFKKTVSRIEAKLDTLKGTTNVAVADFEKEIYEN